MAEKEKGGAGFDPRTAIVVATLIGGLYLIPSTLRSSRPSERETLERTALGDQIVPARLWQDPFEVVIAYREKHRDTRPPQGKASPDDQAKAATNSLFTLKETAEQIIRHSRSTGKAQPDTTVLEVMMSGGSYAEDAELRHRSRYAVLSALAVAGYVPCDEEHIGYAEVRWPRGRDFEHMPTNHIPRLENMPTSEDSNLVIPFEWFVPNELRSPNSTGHILVLWLNDDAFADHPAKRLAQLNQHLRDHLPNDTAPPVVNFKLLDPRLHDLFNEEMAGPTYGIDEAVAGELRLPDALTNLALYSSWATTPDALLKANADGWRGQSIKNEITNKGPAFVNVTCTDDQLVEELIDELALRGVDVRDPSQLVVLVSEWDTFYGRALPLTFAATVNWRINDRFTTNSFATNFLHLTAVATNNPFYPICEYLADIDKRLFDEMKPSDPARTNFITILDSLVVDGFPRRVYAALGTNNNPLCRSITNRSRLSHAKQARLNRLLLEAAFPKDIVTNLFSEAVEQLKQGTTAWPPNIIRFSYLRGIDGKAPGEPEAGSKTEPKAGKQNERSAPADDAPRPEGHGQMDYMPRMADVLDALERQKELHGKGEFKAIGVLGSDVYDKLLVLQSLRKRFTDEIFFTTDLDARLTHPDQLNWTRNLIVASSFGLRLNPKLQRQTPPFRDTYQTGRYLACLTALDFPAAVTNLGSLSPRRFEIGRKGAYDLSLNDSPLYPRVPRPSSKERQAYLEKACLLLLVLATALLLVCQISARARQVFSRIWSAFQPRPAPGLFIHVSRRAVLAAILVPGAVLAALGLSAVIDHCNLEGEPVTFTDGISIWPTELLRASASCIALGSLFWILWELRESQSRMQRHFGVRPPTTTKAARWIRFKHGLRGMGLLIWVRKEPAAAKKRVCRIYDRLGFVEYRCARVLFPVMLYCSLAMAILLLFGLPFRPYRGNLSLVWDWVVVLIGYGSQSILIFFVVDASRLCQKFIENLAGAPGSWPPEVCKNFESKYGPNCGSVSEFIDIKIIAERTAMVGKFIFFPFLSLFFMIIARSDFFDRWDWPASIILILGLNSAYALYAVWALRLEAEKARASSLVHLKEKLLCSLTANQPGLSEQLKLLIREIEACEEGAFAPVTQQPVIKALLMPFGGAGVVALLNYLATRL